MQDVASFYGLLLQFCVIFLIFDVAKVIFKCNKPILVLLR
jgi:hypothetical protein